MTLRSVMSHGAKLSRRAFYWWGAVAGLLAIAWLGIVLWLIFTWNAMPWWQRVVGLTLVGLFPPEPRQLLKSYSQYEREVTRNEGRSPS